MIGVACYGEIQVIDSLKPVDEAIAFCDSETLVLIDLGGTLLKAKDALMHDGNRFWISKWCDAHYSDIKQEGISSLIKSLENNPKLWELSDSKWLEVIPEARRKGAKVVAFSKVVFNSASDWICGTNLRKLGLPIQDDLPGLFSGNLYRYQEGVIITENRVKGPVLEEVLAKISMRPKTIIFIDDLERQVQSVDHICKDLGINCIAFHYIAHQAAPFLNEEVANLQMKTLVETRQWISDNEALILLGKGE